MARPAFTIVELLVTVAIIALLLSVTAVNLSTGQASARDSQRLADVSLIGRMIDTSTAARRGSLPMYDDAQPNLATVCADELTDAANKIDYSVFKTKGTGVATIPKDPRPVTVRGQHCTSTANGYLYVTNPPTGQPRNDIYGMSRQYILEVALEHETTTDESQFHTPTELYRNASVSTPAGRSVYALPGPVAP